MAQGLQRQGKALPGEAVRQAEESVIRVTGQVTRVTGQVTRVTGSVIRVTGAADHLHLVSISRVCQMTL